MSSLLKLDWCSHEAATYAVERWHYSKRMPKSKVVRVGVWEDGKFIGCVLFGCGATFNLSMNFGLEQTEFCELTRIALRAHKTPVSRIVAIAIKMLRRACPGLRLIISYADPAEGHHGGIYKAGGWLYLGSTEPSEVFFYKGRWAHGRAVNDVCSRAKGVCKLPRKLVPGKHRYVFVLDERLRTGLMQRVQPCPKSLRVESDTSDTVRDHLTEGGAAPTSTLHVAAAE